MVVVWVVRCYDGNTCGLVVMVLVVFVVMVMLVGGYCDGVSDGGV